MKGDVPRGIRWGTTQKNWFYRKNFRVVPGLNIRTNYTFQELAQEWCYYLECDRPPIDVNIFRLIDGYVRPEYVDWLNTYGHMFKIQISNLSHNMAILSEMFEQYLNDTFDEIEKFELVTKRSSKLEFPSYCRALLVANGPSFYQTSFGETDLEALKALWGDVLCAEGESSFLEKFPNFIYDKKGAYQEMERIICRPITS